MEAAPNPWRLAVAPMMDWTDRHCRYFHRLVTRRSRLYTDSHAKDKFTTTKGGQFFAVGRGSTTVGRGAHLSQVAVAVKGKIAPRRDDRFGARPHGP